MAYIQFEHLVKNYGTNVVLKNINLELKRGSLLHCSGRPAVEKVRCCAVWQGLRA